MIVRKKELLTILKERTGFSKRSLDSVLQALVDIICENEKVFLFPVGTFKHRKVNLRKYTNPKTGQSFYPDRPFVTLSFKPSIATKRIIRETYKDLSE